MIKRERWNRKKEGIMKEIKKIEKRYTDEEKKTKQTKRRKD